MKMQFLLLESPQRTAQHQQDWKETTKPEYKTKLKMTSIHGVTAAQLAGKPYFCTLYDITPAMTMLNACSMVRNYHSARRAMEFTMFESPI